MFTILYGAGVIMQEQSSQQLAPQLAPPSCLPSPGSVTPTCQLAGKIRRKYRRLKHSPLSSTTRRRLLERLAPAAPASPQHDKLPSPEDCLQESKQPSAWSELESLITILQDSFPMLHTERWLVKTQNEGWIVVSR